MIFKKEFYFIRHGLTDYNVSDVKIDHEDVSLNAMGLLQVHAIEPIMAKLPIKSVCHSPLKRAKETKEVISSRLLASHYEMSSLGECSLRVWQDMTLCGPDAYYSGQAHVRDFMHRVLNGLNEALTLEGPVLIVAHGGLHWATCCLMGIVEHEWVIGNSIPVHFFPTRLVDGWLENSYEMSI